MFLWRTNKKISWNFHQILLLNKYFANESCHWENEGLRSRCLHIDAVWLGPLPCLFLFILWFPVSTGIKSRQQRSRSDYTYMQADLDSCCLIAPNKVLFLKLKLMIFFLFLHENICCGYSLEAPHRGASNEYPQHVFSWRNKNIIWVTLLFGALCQHSSR